MSYHAYFILGFWLRKWWSDCIPFFNRTIKDYYAFQMSYFKTFLVHKHIIMISTTLCFKTSYEFCEEHFFFLGTKLMSHIATSWCWTKIMIKNHPCRNKTMVHTKKFNEAYFKIPKCLYWCFHASFQVQANYFQRIVGLLVIWLQVPTFINKCIVTLTSQTFFWMYQFSQ
jgi:hypothetical protein